jgi:hypothetical protein
MKTIIRILIESPHYWGMKLKERLELIKFLLKYERALQ